MKRLIVLFLLLMSINCQAAMVVVDTGTTEILDTYLNNARPSGGNNLTLKLYCTDVTPAESHTASSYTECAGGGYTSKTLANGSWTVTAIGGYLSTGYYAQQTFSFTGSLTPNANAYGYYIVDADNTLILAEKFGSYITPVNCDTIKITPKIQASRGTPN